MQFALPSTAVLGSARRSRVSRHSSDGRAHASASQFVVLLILSRTMSRALRRLMTPSLLPARGDGARIARWSALSRSRHPDDKTRIRLHRTSALLGARSRAVALAGFLAATRSRTRSTSRPRIWFRQSRVACSARCSFLHRPLEAARASPSRSCWERWHPMRCALCCGSLVSCRDYVATLHALG